MIGTDCLFLQTMKRKIALLMLLMLACLKIPAQTATFQQLMQDGDSLRNAQQYQKALHCYLKAEYMVDKQLTSRKASYWLHKAHCHKQLGEFDKALVCYEALEELGPRFAKREDVVLNKSDVLLLTGHYEKTAELLLPLQCTIEEAQVKRLVNLASAYESLGLRKEALALLDDVKQKHAEKKDALYSIATNNKGYVLWAMKHYAEAAKELQEALALFDAAEPKYYQTMGNLALVEAEMMAATEALTHIDQCIEWFATNYGKQHPDYIACIRKRAEILLKTKGKAAALSAFRQFFTAAKSDVISRFANMSTQQRQNYWAMMRPLIAECYALEETDPTFLYDVALFSKSVMLMTSPVIYRQYAKRLNVDVAQIRKSLKKTDDVAVEFVRYQQGDTTRYAALLLPKVGAVRFVKMFSQQEIENYAIEGRSLKELIASNGKRDKQRLFQDTAIAEKIWSPILQKIKPSADIYFATEGVLNILAIEYLNIKPRSGQFYRLSSTRILTERPKTALFDKVLLIGGVDYNDTSRTTSFNQPLPDRYGSRLFFEEQRISKQRIFPYLRGSQRETSGISAALNGCNLTIDSLEQVPEERVKTMMGNFSTVHISTHGYAWQFGNTPAPHAVDSIVADLSLWRSFIVLSGANATAQPTVGNQQKEDGLLTAKELCDMDLSKVGMVVMAACQTGLGRTVDDGLAGIPLGLKKAGVGTVIVSLWEVSDEATQLLMEKLYQNLRSGKCTSVTDALNKARQQLRAYKAEEETSQKPTTGRSSFHAGSMTNQSRKANREKSMDNPFFYNPFIVIDGF